MLKPTETSASILVDDLIDPCAVDAFEPIEVEETSVAQHEERNRAFIGA